MNQPPIQYTVTGHPVRMQGASYLPRSIQALQAISAWKHENAEAPDAWLRSDITSAFKYFLGLKLNNSPAVEMVPITAEMWVEIIGEGMNEEQDRERIREGFRQLCRQVRWWPQPAALLKILPRRQTSPARNPAVTPEPDAEAHARGAEALADILGKLK